MARLSPKGQILELHIRCRVCKKNFDSLLVSGKQNLIITCPFCSNLALAVIEDFSMHPVHTASKGIKDSLENKRKYRI